VKRLGDQILAGPALAIQQDGAGMAGRNAPHQFENLQRVGGRVDL
jgi:hypothetical protein